MIAMRMIGSFIDKFKPAAKFPTQMNRFFSLFITLGGVARYRINESQPCNAFLVPLELCHCWNTPSRELLSISIVITKTVQSTRCTP
jgi:hypothetical protein